jgi:hypothetical protein
MVQALYGALGEDQEVHPAPLPVCDGLEGEGDGGAGLGPRVSRELLLLKAPPRFFCIYVVIHG